MSKQMFVVTLEIEAYAEDQVIGMIGRLVDDRRVLSFRIDDETALQEEQPNPIKWNDYLIVWVDKFSCWCIYDENGNKVREPLWGTTGEAVAAIESGEAL